MDIMPIKKINEILRDNGFSFKKKYGQNFIMDNNTLDNIIKASALDKDTLVIEIGVGSGVLTQRLAINAGFVLGYEIDKNLKPVLGEVLSGYDNVEVIYDDFLKRNIKKDLESQKYEKIYVVANLPYYITTPIIMKIINEGLKISKLIIMVQKEVGDRFNAKVSTKEYNSLSIFIEYFFEVKKVLDVSKNVFLPKPNVDSIVLEMRKKEKNKDVLDESLFFGLVRDAFSFKRKTLKNNLKGYNLEIIENVLKEDNLDLSVRAEALTLNQFIRISNALKQNNG